MPTSSATTPAQWKAALSRLPLGWDRRAQRNIYDNASGCSTPSATCWTTRPNQPPLPEHRLPTPRRSPHPRAGNHVDPGPRGQLNPPRPPPRPRPPYPSTSTVDPNPSTRRMNRTRLTLLAIACPRNGGPHHSPPPEGGQLPTPTAPPTSPSTTRPASPASESPTRIARSRCSSAASIHSDCLTLNGRISRGRTRQTCSSKPFKRVSVRQPVQQSAKEGVLRMMAFRKAGGHPPRRSRHPPRPGSSEPPRRATPAHTCCSSCPGRGDPTPRTSPTWRASQGVPVHALLHIGGRAVALHGHARIPPRRDPSSKCPPSR